MKTISLYLAVGLMIASFIIGLASGYFVSPSYELTRYGKESMEMGLGAPDRFLDLRYIDKMAAHHKGAILLAEQVSDKTKRQEIKNLAADIKKGEPVLIEELFAWKKDWYKDDRKAKDPTVPNLGPADEKIDLRFLNALIAHHEAGIEMTKEVRTKSSRKEILDNADAVENFLKGSIVMLKGWREAWFNVK